MKSKNKIAIVIPTYNEEKTIGRMVQNIDDIFKEHYKNYQIVVMNDCSTDKSLEIVNELKKKIKKLKVITNKKNMGKTKTVMSGFEIIDADIFSFIDADYQYDPLDLPAVIDKVLNEGYDICSGTRRNRKDNLYSLGNQ